MLALLGIIQHLPNAALGFFGFVQKYFIAALIAGVLLLGATAATYRANYLVAQQQRQTAEARLQETIASLDSLRRSHAAQIEALTQAAAAAAQHTDQRRTSRERVLNAKPPEDGPVSPVLRCAVTGVC